MEIPAQTDKFTPLQHDLLRMFAAGIKEDQLMEIRQLLADYFARKLTEAADRHLEGQDIEAWNRQILSQDLRTPDDSNK